MGVSDLVKVIEKHASDGIHERPMSHYRGQRLGIDLSLSLYRYCHQPNRRRKNFHIMGFFAMFYEMLRNGVTPVVVMDGRVPEAKRAEIEHRHQEQEAKRTKIQELRDAITKAQDSVEVTNLRSDLEQAEKHFIDVTDDLRQDIRDLCEVMGIPLIQANEEADALCAKMAQIGLIEGVLSEDMDFLPFGCPKLIRGFKASSNSMMKEYHLADILEKLELSRDQLIDLCALLGCDYNRHQGITGLGPAIAFKQIRQHGTIENFINYVQNGQGKYTIPTTFEYLICRHEYHQALERETCPSVEQITLRRPKLDMLRALLIDRVGYKSSTVDKRIKEIQLIMPIYETQIAEFATQVMVGTGPPSSPHSDQPSTQVPKIKLNIRAPAPKTREQLQVEVDQLQQEVLRLLGENRVQIGRASCRERV